MDLQEPAARRAPEDDTEDIVVAVRQPDRFSFVRLHHMHLGQAVGGVRVVRHAGGTRQRGEVRQVGQLRSVRRVMFPRQVRVDLVWLAFILNFIISFDVKLTEQFLLSFIKVQL